MKKYIILMPLLCAVLAGCSDSAKISVPENESSSDSQSAGSVEATTITAEKNPETDEGKKEIIDIIFSAYEENKPEKVYELFNPKEIENISKFNEKNNADFDQKKWDEKITEDTVVSAISADIEAFQGYIAEWESEKENIEWEETYYIVDDYDEYAQQKQMYENFLEETEIEYSDDNLIELGKLNEENKIGEPIGFSHYIYKSEGKYWLSYAVEIDYLVNSGFLDYSFQGD